MSTFYEPPARSEELYHYGVLGMKWGMRKARKLAAAGNVERARAVTDKNYAKAGKKLAKMDRKIEKLQNKAVKFQQKADRNAYGWFGSQKKAKKYNFKASRQQYKANKKAQKALKWQKKMQKEFGKKNMRQLNPEHQKLGQKYADQLRRRAQNAM